MNHFTDDEMNILATAVANLCNTRSLCKVSPDPYQPEKTKYRILCADGKKRRMKRKQIVELVEKVAKLAGHEVTDDVKDVMQMAGLR